MKVLLSIKAIKAVVVINWEYPVFPKANDRICISDFIEEDMANIFKEEEYVVGKKVLTSYDEIKDWDEQAVTDFTSLKNNVTCTIQPSLKFRKEKDGGIYCILDARL